MNEVELLLSDEFVEFSTKVKEIHEAKKAKQLEFKAVYDKYKADVQVMDDAAKSLQEIFETWKSGQNAAKTPAKVEKAEAKKV